MKKEFAIKVNNTIFYSIKNFYYNTTLDNLVSTVNIDVYDPDNICTIGATCEAIIRVGLDVIIFTGYIVAITETFTPTSRNKSLVCKSKLVDLVECSALLRKSYVNKNLISLIREIANPFDIKVIDNIGKAITIPKFNFQIEETAFNAIERLCKFYAILPIDLNGNLLLSNSDVNSKSVATFKVTNNVKELTREENSEETFSEYIGVTQYSGNGEVWKKSILSTEAKAKDSNVKRYRPKLFLAETWLEQKNLIARVNWEAQVRAGRSRTYQLTTIDPLNNFSPWNLYDLVTIDTDKNIDTCIISSIDISKTPTDGTNVRFNLVPPSTYAREPGQDVKLT